MSFVTGHVVATSSQYQVVTVKPAESPPKAPEPKVSYVIVPPGDRSSVIKLVNS